jgi:L-ribulose-5-phosphate 3-epimerase
MFQLGIITDEVHDDLAKACEFLKDAGIELVELRILGGTNILELSKEAIEEAKSILDAYELKVVGLSSPIFKSPLEGKQEPVASGDFMLEGHRTFEEQLGLLEHAADLCKVFDTSLVRVFTFLRGEWSKSLVERIAEHLLEGAKIAKKHNITLAVENEPICNVRHGREMGELFDCLEKIGSPALLKHLTILWDPGNAVYAGELDASIGGHEAVRGKVGHVHVKDVIFDTEGNPHCVPVGKGEVDYLRQISALIADGYTGPLVLEPHYLPEGGTRMEGAREAIGALRKLLQKIEKN